MRWRSIRVRLTAWYAAVLAVGLGLFGISAWLALNRSLNETIDESLEDRVAGVRRFMEDQLEALSIEEIRMEFREHSVLGPGGDLFQVCDGQGNWLYRSASLADGEVPIRLPDTLPKKGIYENRLVLKSPLRFLSRPVEVRGQRYTVQVAAPMGEFLEATKRFQLALLVLIPGVLLVACAGGYWMSRRALAPIDRIIDDTSAIGARNLERRLQAPQTKDELERLSHTINSMLDRLEAAFRRITQFTADASHELRTPTALVRTTAELALRKKRAPAEYEQALRQILSESERITALIDNLLTLARADSGCETLKLEAVDLSAAMQEPVAAGRKLAEARGLSFEARLSDGPCPVTGDTAALRRLAMILIDNAMKYTPAPGWVRVSIRKAAGSAILEVQDSGIGISTEDLPHIFERFYRADKARGCDGGAGLGLSIAKWIVEQHGGEIKVASGPSQGATFRVHLPLAA